jgi:2-(1,2-epoxy-1,2-dihydrophenyl)acetyl-CoA isomerase
MNDTHSPVRLSMADGVAHIRFNRPQTLNTIDVPLSQCFLSCVEQALSDASTRVIVLSGEGRAFMAGGDLQPFHADFERAPVTARQIINPLHEAIARLAEGAPPTIASVQGAVAGAGLSITMGCDLAVAADNARFVPAYSKIAASQDGGGSWALPRLVGLHKAMEIALLSDAFDAAEALRLGLVNRVVPLADLEVQTMILAKRLAEGPTRTYGRIKRLLRDSLDRPLREQLAAERESFATCASEADFREGLQSFFEKRSPVFRGR